MRMIAGEFRSRRGTKESGLPAIARRTAVNLRYVVVHIREHGQRRYCVVTEG
jgi:hypothetical protein